ncbi:MAG: DUF4105 domain-containing protein [Spirochaetes bacterium]|nr:DUF4105 domain-containing protein [Spirochaetota bacterium]
MLPVFFFLLTILSAIPFQRIRAQDTAGQTDQAIPTAEHYLRKARELRLHEERYWNVLVHYQKGICGTKSLIDDPDFFLAKNGKTNPWAELEATIRFLCADKGGDAPACRFPGRAAWLNERLGDPGVTPPFRSCAKVDETMARIKPSSMALIFPVGFMGSPASMYGHTFLIVESEGKSRLMSFAVNYQAHALDKFGFIFAFKGLFGFYEGYYDVLPYYEKVKEYSDLDKRDIWEYPLNLDRKEISRFMNHLFEMNNIHSDYYFLDENCSYNLLFMLEAARPSVNLTDRFGPFITPVDTTRAVIDSGLTEKPLFRPSKLSKLRHLSSRLDAGEIRLVREMAGGRVNPDTIGQLPLPVDKKIAVADLLCEYLQFSYIDGDISQKQYAQMIIPALRARSSLGPPSEETADMTVPPQPEAGHLPYRISAYGTLRIENGTYSPIVHITWRPTCHRLIDRDEGYNPGSEIVFINFDFRYNTRTERFSIHRIDLVDMASLNPITWYSLALSWRIKTGFIEKFGNDGDEHLLYDFDTAFGLSAELPLLGLTYGMIELVADIGPSREHWVNGAAGATAGFVQRVASFLKIHYSARCVYYCITERNLLLETSCQHNLIITANTGILGEFTYRYLYYPFRRERMQDMYEATLAGYVFF